MRECLWAGNTAKARIRYTDNTSTLAQRLKRTEAGFDAVN